MCQTSILMSQLCRWIVDNSKLQIIPFIIQTKMKQMLGLEINSIQNVLLSCACFFLVLYLLATLIEKKPTWFLSKTLRQTHAMEDKFQKLVASRRDILHHYYWARSEQDSKKMKDMDKDLLRIDEQIQQLRQEYKKKKMNVSRIIQKLF